MASSKPRPEAVASIISDRADADFIRTLMAAAAAFAEPTFEGELSEYLRERADLVDRWATYSGDQRGSPAPYVDGTEAGWFDVTRREVIHHPDEAAAVADFIRRKATYLAANRVDVPRESLGGH